MPRRSRASGRPSPSRASSRARAGGHPRSASSTSRTAPSPVSRRAASKQPAVQKSAQAPPPATQQPQQGSAMGGFMANVASTGLGVMAGRAMDRAFFGGGGSGAAPEMAPEPADDTHTSAAWEEQLPETICAREVLEFKRCLDRNECDVASCQWNLDILQACQRQHQESGFADASRL